MNLKSIMEKQRAEKKNCNKSKCEIFKKFDHKSFQKHQMCNRNLFWRTWGFLLSKIIHLFNSLKIYNQSV